MTRLLIYLISPLLKRLRIGEFEEPLALSDPKLAERIGISIATLVGFAMGTFFSEQEPPQE
jgi:hypothetical protein